jgi:kynurenine formamidase
MPDMAEYMGVPEGEYAAVEQVNISTRNGTHLDAHYHSFSCMDEALVSGGRPSMRIDEVPLD